MVQSHIDKTIQYPDIKTIEPDDIGYDAVQFQIELMPDMEAMIALGKVRYTFVDKGVLYLPVYLIHKGSISDQIGVYEFLGKNYVNLFDSDGDFDITRLENPIPLFYPFVTPNYLQKQLNIPDESDEEDAGVETPRGETKQGSPKKGESKQGSPPKGAEEGTTVETGQWSSPNKPTLLEQIRETEDDSPTVEEKQKNVELMNEDMAGRQKYIKKTGHNWLQIYMKNSHYHIINNEGGGDCLFAVIRDAFLGIPKEITVSQLRSILSDQATEKIFQIFREQFDMYAKVIHEGSIKKTHNLTDLKVAQAEFNREKGRTEKRAIVERANRLLQERAEIKQNVTYARELIQDFTFMKKITSLTKFKEKIKTCSFWANTWTLSILEKILQIKLIIMHRGNYRAEDLDNVLQCGNAIDDEIIQKGFFKPRYYILLEFRIDPVGHYTLITYNGRRIFRFHELPFGIKQLIVSKCMEQDQGIYNMIPKFKQLKNQLHPKEESDESGAKEGKPDDNKPVGDPPPATDSGAEDIGEPKEESFDEGFEKRKQVDFDKDTIFQFYSKSAEASPGKGSGEKIKKGEQLKYAALGAIKGWRKQLSNFSNDPFQLDGHRWFSVEHFYHASKFKQGHPDFYRTFSLDSKSDLSRDPILAKIAGGKTGKSKKRVLRPSSIQIDADFFTSGRNERAMYRAQMAKYSQNEKARKVLLHTGRATLQHFVRGRKPIVFYDTMKIREILLKKEK